MYQETGNTVKKPKKYTVLFNTGNKYKLIYASETRTPPLSI